MSDQLTHDEGGGDRAGPDGGGDAQDLRPMGAHEPDIEPPCDHRRQRGRIGWAAEAVEPSMLQLRNARRELEAEQGAECEYKVSIAAAIGVVPPGRHLAPV